MKKLYIVALATTVMVAMGIVQAGVSFAATVTCPPNLSSTTVNGTVDVPAGSTCVLTGVTINGNVTIGSGATVTATNTTVNGSVSANNPKLIESLGGNVVTGNVFINGTQGLTLACTLGVGNNLSIQNSRTGGAGFALVGTPSPGCIQVGNNVNLANNKFSIPLSFANVGNSASITGNTAAVVVAGDSIAHFLSCFGNTPAPTNGGGNTIGATAGQCTGF